MKYVFAILKGAVIGLANLIPGVSGGTMMVSMGIYDTLIGAINHLFKQFKKSLLTLLPYILGMAASIAGLSFVMKWAFTNYQLPTNALFIGLILGGLPAIFKEMKGTKINFWSVLLFLSFAAVVVLLQVFNSENTREIQLSFAEVIKLFLMGVIASSAMVIPGISGSMILKTLGYYEPVVSEAIPGLITAIGHGEWSVFLHNGGILLPFGFGIVFGIFAVAKLIDVLLARQKGMTYSAILGLVVASPVAILMSTSFTGLSAAIIIGSIVSFAVGFVAAMLLGRGSKQENKI